MKTAYIKYDNTKPISKINKEIYGHFSEHLGRCIYNGIFVGKDSDIPNTNGIRNDVLEALKEIKTPVLRWPGGCFADEYHWQDGIGKNRSPILNTNWGGVVEDNSFGTDEFFNLCELLGCEPYLAGNLASGTVRELASWLEYITHWGDSPMALKRKENGRQEPWKLKYLGIGNENWGCGGNMRPEAYADEYRRYASFAKNYNNQDMLKVACGPNSDDYAWTESLMQNLKPWHTGAISLHYYTVPTGNWDKKGAALNFDDKEYYQTIVSTMNMDEIITKHTAIMDKYNPDNSIRLIVDEWGCWYDVEDGTNPGFLYQQNTMRDAIVAGINLNIFNNHSKRVMMANLAQVVNVLQSVILTEGDSMVKTPTWHVFKMYLDHHDAQLVRSSSAVPMLDECGKTFPMITSSVSVNNGQTFITLTNCSLNEDCELLLDSEADDEISEVSGEIICTDISAYNDFDKPENVFINSFSDFEIDGSKLKVHLPAHSVVSLRIK